MMNAVISALFLCCALLFSSVAQAADKIVLIPGWDQNPQRMVSLQKELGGEIMITSSRLPLWRAAEELNDQISLKDGEKLVLVGFSWGGLISRQFAEMYPEKVRTVVVIGSPNGGYRFAPKELFRINVEKSRHVLVYVVAGEKSVRRWWLSEVNDGVVDLESALNLPFRRGLVLNLEHYEMLGSGVVSSQIRAWLAAKPTDRFAAR